jgi:hypothetical protein
MNNPLFTSCDDWQNNACINHVVSMMSAYIDGYKTAADILASRVVVTARDQDILVYPIAFLYRQHIELLLKYIIKESRILLVTKDQGFPKSHDILNLWRLVKDLMNNIIETVDPSVRNYITKEDMSDIQSIIGHYVQLDPDSMAFRYSEDASGNNTMSGITHINIRNFSEHISRISELLKKFELVVDILREKQYEISSSCEQ